MKTLDACPFSISASCRTPAGVGTLYISSGSPLKVKFLMLDGYCGWSNSVAAGPSELLMLKYSGRR